MKASKSSMTGRLSDQFIRAFDAEGMKSKIIEIGNTQTQIFLVLDSQPKSWYCYGLKK